MEAFSHQHIMYVLTFQNNTFLNLSHSYDKLIPK